MISNLTYITQWPTKVDLNGSKKRIRWQNELQLALFEYVFQTFKDLWGGISETVCFETCFIIHPPCVEAFLVGGGLWNMSQSNLFQNSPPSLLGGEIWNRFLWDLFHYPPPMRRTLFCGGGILKQVPFGYVSLSTPRGGGTLFSRKMWGLGGAFWNIT